LESNDVTLPGVVRALPSKSLWPLRVEIDKDVVRRIVGKHYRPESGGGGPSWLTFLGQAKDSLWSTDLFRCESLSLRNALGAGGYGPVHSSGSSGLAFTADLSMDRHCA
jgi:hypothetical protein